MPRPEDRIYEPGATRAAIKDAVRKGLLTGLGAALLTRERIGQVMDRLVQEGKVTTDEARRMTDELVEKGRGEFKDLQERIQESLHKGLRELDVATTKDHETLEKRIESLEKANQALEIRLGALEKPAKRKSGDKGNG